MSIASNGFSGDKAHVFLTLASNPSMTEESRDYLAERVAGAGLFSSDHARVVARLVSAQPRSAQAAGT